MEFSHPPQSIPKIKELLAILEPYAAHWQRWIQSGASFLSPTEIYILQDYLQHGTHETAAAELKLPLPTIAFIMQLSVTRLHRKYYLFQSWLTEQLLEEHGLVQYSSAQYRFLYSPLSFLDIPYTLKTELGPLQQHCIADILARYKEAELRACWSITKQGMQLFKRLLKKHGCLHLLH